MEREVGCQRPLQPLTVCLVLARKSEQVFLLQIRGRQILGAFFYIYLSKILETYKIKNIRLIVCF